MSTSKARLAPGLCAAFLLACKAEAAPGEEAVASAATATASASAAPATTSPVEKAPPLPPLAPSAEVVEALKSDRHAQYEEDIRFIARERNQDREHWQAVQDRCAEVFASSGFEVERVAFAEGINVIGRKQGSDPTAPLVVVGAHYDHIDGCEGADDNASGTAAILEIARILGPLKNHHAIEVACWDAEEEGLLGSDAYAQKLADNQRKIEIGVSLDAIAFTNSEPQSQKLPPGLDLLFPKQIAQLEARDFRADFIGVLFDEKSRNAARWFSTYAKREALALLELEIPTPLLLIDATAHLRRSDHASFWRREMPGLLVNDTANFRTRTYHCWDAPDLVETLDLPFAYKVTRSTAAMVAELALAQP